MASKLEGILTLSKTAMSLMELEERGWKWYGESLTERDHAYLKRLEEEESYTTVTELAESYQLKERPKHLTPHTKLYFAKLEQIPGWVNKYYTRKKTLKNVD